MYCINPKIQIRCDKIVILVTNFTEKLMMVPRVNNCTKRDVNLTENTWLMYNIRHSRRFIRYN